MSSLSSSIQMQSISSEIPFPYPGVWINEGKRQGEDYTKNLSLIAPISSHDTSLRRNTPLRTSLQFGIFLFAVATNTYNSPNTKSRFHVVLKSFVPMWIITVSGLPRCVFSIILFTCSVLIPWKYSTIISVCSAPTLSNIQLPTIIQFATFCFACTE